MKILCEVNGIRNAVKSRFQEVTLHNVLLCIINKASSARSANDEALVVQTDSEVGIYYGDCIEKKTGLRQESMTG